MLPLLSLVFFSVAAFAGDPAVFPANLSKAYRVRIDKDADLLESIHTAIKKNGVVDGAVLTAAGSLGECAFHGVGGSKQAVKEEMEINHLGGIIADGEPHLHVVLTNAKRGAFGGHLEAGCRVSNRVELTIVQFSGAPLVRVKGSLEPKK